MLGPGLLESVYEEAVAIELALRGIPFERQVRITLAYKGHLIGEGRLDLLVDDRLVLEPKAVDKLVGLHQSQLRSYLTATRYPLGLLINFNVELLKDGLRRVLRR